MAATRLERLFVKEVSGVDDPANENPGWTVMKSRTAEELVAEVDAELQLAKAYGDVLQSLAAATEYLDGAPDEVLSAVETIVKYIRSANEGGSGGEAAAAGETEKVAEPEAEAEAPADSDEGATKMLDRIRALRKRKDEMNEAEIDAKLEARDEALKASFAEQLETLGAEITKSVTDALAAATEEVEEEKELTAEAEAEEVAKSEGAAEEILEAIGKLNEVAASIADRQSRLEKRMLGSHREVEDDDIEKADGASELSKGLAAALRTGKPLILR